MEQHKDGSFTLTEAEYRSVVRHARETERKAIAANMRKALERKPGGPAASVGKLWTEIADSIEKGQWS